MTVRGGRLFSKTTSDIITILKSILEFAEKLSVPVNFSWESLSVKKEAKDIRVLSISEQKRLQRHLLNQPDNFKLGMLLSLFTGIRIGELCALKWQDIHLSEKAFHIHATLQRIQNTKSDENC